MWGCESDLITATGATQLCARTNRLRTATLATSELEGAGWVLKGGYALELRFLNARATKDMELVFARLLDVNTAVANFPPRQEMKWSKRNNHHTSVFKAYFSS